MSILPFKQKYKIRSYEVDSFDRLKLSSLWDILQDAASIHAKYLGFDYYAMKRNCIFWVLCRMSLEVIFCPKMGDEIIVSTVPVGVDKKIFAVRDYEVTDLSGSLIAKARSCWIIANLSTLKPEKIQSHVPQLNMPVEGKIPGKIRFCGEKTGERQVIAGYGDIDLNKHVNNGRYISWIEDTMDYIGFYPHLRSLQVNYIAEEKKGACIIIKTYKKENQLYFEMINTDGKLILQAIGTK